MDGITINNKTPLLLSASNPAAQTINAASNVGNTYILSSQGANVSAKEASGNPKLSKGNQQNNNSNRFRFIPRPGPSPRNNQQQNGGATLLLSSAPITGPAIEAQQQQQQQQQNNARTSGNGLLLPGRRENAFDKYEAIIGTKHFNRKELLRLFDQFKKMADKKMLLDMDGFRQSMGILGMVQDSLLCQRLFFVFNTSKSGYLDFPEYAKGLGILMKGTVDEKLDFAFSMTDIDNSGEITFEELQLTVSSIMRIYSGIMGSNVGEMDLEKIRLIFNSLDKNQDGSVTREEYKRGMKKHPELAASLGGIDMYHTPVTREADDLKKKMKQYSKITSRLSTDMEKIMEHIQNIGLSLNEIKNFAGKKVLFEKRASAAFPSSSAFLSNENRSKDDSTIEAKRPASMGPGMDLSQKSSLEKNAESENAGEDSDDNKTILNDDIHTLESQNSEKIEETEVTKKRKKPTIVVNESVNKNKGHDNMISIEREHVVKLIQMIDNLNQVIQVLKMVEAPTTVSLNTHSKQPLNPPVNLADEMFASPVKKQKEQVLVASTSNETNDEPKANDVNINDQKLSNLTDNQQSNVDQEIISHNRRQSSEQYPISPTRSFLMRQKSSPKDNKLPRTSSRRGFFSPKSSNLEDNSDQSKRKSFSGSVSGAPGSKNNSGGPNDEKEDEVNDAKLAHFLRPASKGSTVFFGHKNWDLVLNVMKGIQMAVARTAAEASRPISAFDFSVKEKYTLVAGANFRKISKHGDEYEIDNDQSGRSCRFIDYAPFVFAKLRMHFGISSEEYIQSIGPGNMLSNLMFGSLSSLAELGSEGKSGSFFYFTSDGKYMVKTIRKDEHKLIRSILHQYYHHMTRVSVTANDKVADSLLCRIVGCHVVRLSKHSKVGANKIYFVVMTNMLNTDLRIDRRYDLKGSWVGRKTKNIESRNDPKTTLKDLDFKDLGQKIRVGPERKALLMSSLRRDCDFLERHNLIDYSLLLGIHVRKDAESSSASDKADTPTNYNNMSSTNLDTLGEADLANEPKSLLNVEKEEKEVKIPYFQADNGGLLSSDGKETYILGVIDFLTQYTGKKRFERAMKTMIFQDRAGMSVMPAHGYAKRFLKFMETNIE